MPDDLDLDDEQQGPEGLRQYAKSLKRQLKDLNGEVDRLRPLERENVFLKAGIDPADAKLRYFVKGYDGELSMDAVKAAATEAGFFDQPAAQQQAEPDPREGEMAQLQRLGQASAGTQPTTADKSLTSSIYAAKSQREVLDLLAQAGHPSMDDVGY